MRCQRRPYRLASNPSFAPSFRCVLISKSLEIMFAKGKVAREMQHGRAVCEIH